MTSARQRGIALLEVVIAFAILAMSFAAVLQASGRSNVLQGDATAAIHAASVADSLLADLGGPVPLRPGTVHGVQEGCRWSVTIAEAGRAAAGAVLLQINVHVAWDGSRGERRLRVDTLRMASERL